MSTAKLPTRTRPNDGRFHRRGLQLIEGVGHPDPPPAPDHLGDRARELFAQAWTEPESTLWRRSDAARVARWAHLSARAETDPAAWVFAALSALERQLVMTPLARASAGVTVEPAGQQRAPARGSRASRGRRSRLSPDVRRELAALQRDDPLGAADEGEGLEAAVEEPGAS